MKQDCDSNRPDVAVAVCTRNRPDMLRATLQSLAALDLGDLACRFIVVENGDQLTVAPIVNELSESVGAERVVVATEPRLGIAHARNRALDIAMEMGAAKLAFIDDDEVADRKWLSALMETARGRDLHLVGGPVRLLPAPENASGHEQMVWRGTDARFRGIEASGRRLAARGRDGRITIVTSNWLIDLPFARSHGLRFDGALGLSSGSDTKFHRALRAVGGKTGWAPQAVVSEVWTRERLSLNYHFRRARDQARARHHAKFAKLSFGSIATSVPFILFRLVGGLLRVFQSIFDRGASLVRAVRAFGAAVGTVDALRGRQSRHYESVSGS